MIDRKLSFDFAPDLEQPFSRFFKRCYLHQWATRLIVNLWILSGDKLNRHLRTIEL
jgi:hypothetical protein